MSFLQRHKKIFLILLFIFLLFLWFFSFNIAKAFVDCLRCGVLGYAIAGTLVWIFLLSILTPVFIASLFIIERLKKAVKR